MCLGVKPSGEPRERARGSDDPMARRNDRDGISAVCVTYGAHGIGIPNLPRDLSVGSGLSERNRQQCGPHLALKGRPDKIQLYIERFPLSSKVFLQLALGLDEHRMSVVLCLDVQPHTTWAVVLPQDPSEAFVSSNQLESPDGRVHHPAHITLLCSVINLGHGTLLLSALGGPNVIST